MKLRALLLDGHTIQALPMMKALTRLNAEVTIFCEDRISYGYFSRYARHRVLCPAPKTDETAYLNFLLEYIRMHPQDLVIPLFNDTAEFASRHKAEIETSGSKVDIPAWEVFIRGHDKELLMEACKALGIPHPRTANPEKIGYEKAIGYVGYPCLIKPNLGAGAKGIKIIHSRENFERYYQTTVQKFGASCIQEFIPQTGTQYKVQLYRSESGAIVASSVYEKSRYYPLDGGTSTCNLTIERPDLVGLYARVLDYLDWVGMADFDCIEDPRDGIVKLMEINPRVPGTIKASFISGVNFAEVMVDRALGNGYKSYRYMPGKILRNFATELLWFYKSGDRFHTRPNWFRFFGKNVYYADGAWSDPLPMIAGFLGGIKKLASADFRKSKHK
ncbi:Predicted ATP-dependent carboligase, ATP-grasp superfamily [Alistipes timonensis JC136]|uniref:Predicted ATP-dependent carboligase, ATP-grasp superfamily n=2 Tax=Alistipes timonensis TaxID=1465754 RepID=A0A1H4EK30_9BACT|nr:Predicted ATP-dependent carboligase, ATP-grasp superfamily [Alistipes timonensis JC136]